MLDLLARRRRRATSSSCSATRPTRCGARCRSRSTRSSRSRSSGRPRGPGRRRAPAGLGAERVLVHSATRRWCGPTVCGGSSTTDVGPRAPSRCSTRECATRTATGASSAWPTAASSTWSRSWTRRPRSAPSTRSGAARCSLHAPWLWPNLASLPLSPKGEYYLPDLVNLARAQGLAVRATLDRRRGGGPWRERPRAARRKPTPSCASARSTSCMRSGVTIVDPATTYIEPEVEIEPDAIDPAGLPPARADAHRARLRDRTEHATSSTAQIGAGSRVWFSVLEGARVGERVSRSGRSATCARAR